MKNRIKQDMVTAMKVKNIAARDILRVLKGEIERNEQSSKGKVDLSDGEIISIIRKLVENSQDVNEIEVLEGYLPVQLDTKEVTAYAKAFISANDLTTPRDMGRVMGFFKQNHAGTYDGKELSGIVKELLT